MKRRGRALRRRYGYSRERLNEKQIADRLVKSADRLFTDRVELRADYDVLQGAYDDASGLAAKGMYGNIDVKKTRDEVHELDAKIGQVARDMENLARKIRKGEHGGFA